MSTDPAGYGPDGYAVIGACSEVHTEMGNGYLEDVYQESLELELTDRNIQFVSQPKLPITYKGRLLRKHYEADLLVLDADPTADIANLRKLNRVMRDGVLRPVAELKPNPEPTPAPK